MIRPFIDRSPIIHETAFVADSADVIGDVRLGRDSSIWFNATVRGDVHRIRIGNESNVQDNAVIHVTHGTAPTTIGDRVTIGHSAVVHGCTIRNEVLIGIGSIILDHTVVGTQSIVGAGALVTGGMEIPPRSMVLGVPARVVRPLTDEEVATLSDYASNYVRYKNIFTGVETPDTNPFYTPTDD
ncbi:MAG: gamma carbonic anhydrase family protein [Rhodothermales bacterium]|nr:gamma carbonic anhydrase family protein [Rhodothermales bacterium]